MNIFVWNDNSVFFLQTTKIFVNAACFFLIERFSYPTGSVSVRQNIFILKLADSVGLPVQQHVDPGQDLLHITNRYSKMEKILENINSALFF